MKKVNTFILVFIMISMLCISSYASGIIPAYYTDVKAYVNLSPIAAVSINGGAYVFVDELANYGFELIWNEADRTLTVKNGEYIPYDELITEENISGAYALDAKETDIRLYLNETEVPCYATDKGIVTFFDNFSEFGSMKWSEAERKIRLTTGVYEYYVNFPDTVNYYFEEFPDVPTPESVGATKYEIKYSDNQLSGVIYAYPRKNITKEMYDAYTKYLIDEGFKYRGNVNWDSNVWFQKEGRSMLIGVDEDYLYVKIFFENEI